MKPSRRPNGKRTHYGRRRTGQPLQAWHLPPRQKDLAMLEHPREAAILEHYRGRRLDGEGRRCG